MKLKGSCFMLCESKFQPRNELPENLPDMLRYDLAFQSNQNRQLIMFPSFRTADGTLGGKVTYKRWDSFGVTLTNIDTPDYVSPDPSTWITYRHPRIEGSGYDYTKLVPITLKEFLAAKDVDEVDGGR